MEQDVDVVVAGSGAAGLAAALRAAAVGLRVLIVEKSSWLGGTTAMSGGCIWVPGNHLAAAAGIADDPEEAMDHIHAVSPPGWSHSEAHLWAAFVDNAPRMLEFLEDQTPLRFSLVEQPDPYVEWRGGRAFGRNVSPLPVSLTGLGALRQHLRPATIPQAITYGELVGSGVFFRPIKAMARLGPRAVLRSLKGQRAQGGGLVAGLLQGCIAAGCSILRETRICGLVQDGTGAVTAVRIEAAGRPETVRVRKGVVIATGGFEWNPEMLDAYRFPGTWENGSPRENEGDGQRIAAEAGAKLDLMDQALFAGVMPIDYLGHPHGQPTNDYGLPHAILVNGRGERFVNESQMNIGLAFVRSETGMPSNLPAWRLFDAQYARRHRMAVKMLGKREGFLKRFATLDALAEGVGLPADTLGKTVDRFNRMVRQGHDEDYRRGDLLWDRVYTGDDRISPNPCLGTIEEPPFYAAPFTAAYLGTKGGARTNARGQVLNAEGAPIGGLYCAGNAMANPFGSKGVGAGTTLGPCLTWGFICGADLAGDTSPPSVDRRHDARSSGCCGGRG